MFFKLQLQICSPLDRANFWIKGSTHVILQVVWLDPQKDIWRERDKCFAFYALYFGVSSSCLYCTNWGYVLICLLLARFSALVGDSLVFLLIIVELFFWSGQPVVLPLH